MIKSYFGTFTIKNLATYNRSHIYNWYGVSYRSDYPNSTRSNCIDSWSNSFYASICVKSVYDNHQ